MAKPRKGVIPAALKGHQFGKGGKPPAKVTKPAKAKAMPKRGARKR